MRFELGQRVAVNGKEHGTIVEALNPSFPNCDARHWVKRDVANTANLYPTSSLKALSPPVGSLIDDLDRARRSYEFLVSDAPPEALENHIGEEASKLDAEVLQPLINHVEDVVQKNADNTTLIPMFELNGYNFTVGGCEETGDCGKFVAGINVTSHRMTEIGKWYNRIEVYGSDRDSTTDFRDMIYFAIRGNPKSEPVRYEGDDSPISQGKVGTAQFYQHKYKVEQAKHAETMSKLDVEVRSNDAKDNQLAAARMIEENMATEISELHARVEGLIELTHLQRDIVETEKRLQRDEQFLIDANARILELDVHLDDLE